MSRLIWHIIELMIIFGLIGVILTNEPIHSLTDSQKSTVNTVIYNLFKIGQNSPDSFLVWNGWKPVSYTCQIANIKQLALGFDSTVCGYNYIQTVHNTITDAGLDWVVRSIATTKMRVSGAGGRNATYIVLSTDSVTPNATDCQSNSRNECNLAGNLTATAGFAAALGAVTYTNTTLAGTNPTPSYTVVNTFTSGATVNNVQKAALFESKSTADMLSANVGIFVWENTFTSVNMVSGDILQITWTITV